MSDTTDIDKKIAERLHGIFPDPQTARKVIDVVTNQRPPGWSNRSYAPYYKEFHALWIKQYVDQMIQSKENGDPQSIVLHYATHCADGKSHQTLYLQVNQALHFLKDKMDPENKYKQWDALTKVWRDKKRGGVCIDWIPELLEGSTRPQPVLAEPPQNKPLWEQAIDDYLESDRVTPFVKANLALTPEQVLYLKTSLMQLKNIIFDVTPTKIMIVKTSGQ